MKLRSGVKFILGNKCRKARIPEKINIKENRNKGNKEIFHKK